MSSNQGHDRARFVRSRSSETPPTRQNKKQKTSHPTSNASASRDSTPDAAAESESDLNASDYDENRASDESHDSQATAELSEDAGADLHLGGLDGEFPLPRVPWLSPSPLGEHVQDGDGAVGQEGARGGAGLTGHPLQRHQAPTGAAGSAINSRPQRQPFTGGTESTSPSSQSGTQAARNSAGVSSRQQGLLGISHISVTIDLSFGSNITRATDPTSLNIWVIPRYSSGPERANTVVVRQQPDGEWELDVYHDDE